MQSSHAKTFKMRYTRCWNNNLIWRYSQFHFMYGSNFYESDFTYMQMISTFTFLIFYHLNPKLPFWGYFGNPWTNFLKSFKIHVDFTPLFFNLPQYCILIRRNINIFFHFMQIWKFSKNSLWNLNFFNIFRLSPSSMSEGKGKKSWEIKLLLQFILEQGDTVSKMFISFSHIGWK